MITMKDVAREAGVSRPTVSVVLNGRDSAVRISNATRDKILKAVNRLGYRRNLLATAVKKGKTNIIGFIGNDEGEHAMKVITGISRGLSSHNYLLKMLPFEYTRRDLSHIAHQCVEQMIAGLICQGLGEDQLESLHQELELYNIPVVQVDNSFSHDWCPRVVTDDFEGEAMAVRYLYELGHRRIVHVTPEEQSGYVVLRRKGFIKGMQDCGLRCSDANIVFVENLVEATPALEHKFEDILNRLKPTALAFSADPIAMKFMQWAYRQNIRIPDRISVIGFANMGLTRYASPGLTTIEQPFKEMGNIAAEKVIKMAEGNVIKNDDFLPVKLIIRESTARLT